jgi:hypothetical protein
LRRARRATVAAVPEGGPNDPRLLHGLADAPNMPSAWAMAETVEQDNDNVRIRNPVRGLHNIECDHSMEVDEMTRHLIVLTIVSIAAGCATGWRPKRTASSADELIESIRPILPELQLVPEAATNDAVLPGHYTSCHPDFDRLVLSGHELYLFPDRTYLFIDWGDLLPDTIVDKGDWEYHDGLVRLRSDRSLAKRRPRDKTFVLMRFQYEQKKMLLLMGTSWNYSYFLDFHDEEQDPDPGFMMILCSVQKEKGISPEESAPLRAKLMEDCWHPEYITFVDE